MTTERLLSVDEVADLLGVSRRSVFRLIESGDLASVRRRDPKRKGHPGNQWRTYVPAGAHNAFVKSRTGYGLAGGDA